MLWRHRSRTSAFSAEAIAEALGGTPRGEGWRACCPAHDDHTPSLSIHEVNGKILFHCFAECSQDQVLAALRSRGIWPIRNSAGVQAAPPAGPSDSDRASDRQAYALSIWDTSSDAPGTLIEVNLRSRAITISPPAALRFRPALKHTPTGLWWPAMIALVSDVEGKPMAIHRTYLVPDGRGKADVSKGPQKMALGPCRGGTVRLGEPVDGTLVLAEGIETALSIMQVRGTAVWATLGTSGMKGIMLPSGVRDVILAPDGDAAGEKVARSAALRLKREGRRVRIVRPPNGRDFNDALARESF